VTRSGVIGNRRRHGIASVPAAAFAQAMHID
jgi:hypothetical protein